MSAPSRVWRLQGATNFRDLGGYPGAGGRPVRWRRLFRSEHLGALTAADRDALAALGLARAFDFRGVAERAAEPYVLPGLTQHALAIEPTVAGRLQQHAAAGRAPTAALMVELMEELYLRLVDDAAPRYAEFFAHLLADDAPLVFHCTAGKDRTGVAAALLLLALGVPRDVVAQDYLLTNDVYRRPPHADDRIPDDALDVLWSVRASFLAVALQAVERDHGSVERYLERRLGVDAAARRRLGELYLEAG